MSQTPSTVINGPSPENKVPFSDAQPQPDMISSLGDNRAASQFAGYTPSVVVTPRPPTLQRIDSRSTLPVRPPFIQQQIGQRPALPQSQQTSQQQIRQFGPGQPPRPQRPPVFLPNQTPGIRPNPNPNYRPPVAGRPPGQLPNRPPGIFQQRSVPAFGQTRPSFEYDLIRSQTLDSSEIISKPTAENVRSSQEDIYRPNLKSEHTMDEQRKLSSSNTSLNKENEISEKNPDNGYPSRPESRAGSRMDRIIEHEDVDKKSTIHENNMSKNVEFKLPANNIGISEIKKDGVDTIKKESSSVVNGTVNETQKLLSKHLELNNVTKTTVKSEGDNDSGVDESTQGNDQSSNGSPKKTGSSRIPNRTSSTTPTKSRSLSRGSKSPSLKSPESTVSTPGTADKKKVPMNKIQVGSAPSPNLKVVRSKIGSLDNASYKPGGGKVKIESKKLDFKNAAPRIEAKNDKYMPKGGDKKIQQQKLQWNAKSKIGSLENTTHKPKGGDKKIETVKLDFKEKAKSKVGSKDNIKHVPGGGDVKFEEVIAEGEIESKKLDLKVQSKVGSLDNVKHRPGGGDKKIFDDKDYLKQMSAISSENHSLSGSQNSLPSQPEAGGPLADENLNQEH